MTVVFEGYLTSEADELFVDEIFKSISSTLLPTNTINPTTIILTEMGQASALISSHSQDSNTALTTDTPNVTPTITEDYMTVAITNSFKADLSLSLGSNVGAPSAIGNPPAALFPEASLTQYVFPTGWAGRIYVGPNTNPDGSKIEGSYTGPPDIDVSYVDGYSVPITCSSEDVPVSGCNIDLFNQEGIFCANQVVGPVCLNSAQNSPQGPAPLFFAACAGAAYTFPKDDRANQGNLRSNLVSCCIGTSCAAPSRQKAVVQDKVKRI